MSIAINEINPIEVCEEARSLLDHYMLLYNGGWLRDGYEELSTLSDNFSNDTFMEHWNAFIENSEMANGAAVTPAYTLRHKEFEYTFAPYCIQVCGNGMWPNVTGGTPNQYNRRHPHMDNDNLCLGQGKDGYICAIFDYRFEDARDIVQSVLSNYNHYGAYSSLVTWIQRMCTECGDAAKYFCFDCDSIICRHCYRPQSWYRRCPVCDRDLNRLI
jgi:hypothetical protein